jgi:phosphoribosylglycinamide formyltransferase-1
MNIAVLASGTGTNLQALIDHAHGRGGVELVGVASDKPGAQALDRGRAAGIDVHSFVRSEFADRAARDRAIAGWLRDRHVELVVLAGYMQLVSAEFLDAFPDRVINVHPSLLPAFPGLGAIEQALEYGVKVFGVTVFFVDGGVDTGPVIMQRAIELPDVTDPDEVLARLHGIEHELLLEVVFLIAKGAVSFDTGNRRRVVIAR